MALKAILLNVMFLICIFVFPKRLCDKPMPIDCKVISILAKNMETIKAKRLGLLVKRHSKMTNVSPELVARVICVESGGNERAISPDGAKGLMQIMPFWAKDKKRLLDPEYNIRIGCRILESYVRKYGLHGGLSAYNSGRPNSSAGRRYADMVLYYEG